MLRPEINVATFVWSSPENLWCDLKFSNSHVITSKLGRDLEKLYIFINTLNSNKINARTLFKQELFILIIQKFINIDHQSIRFNSELEIPIPPNFNHAFLLKTSFGYQNYSPLWSCLHSGSNNFRLHLCSYPY